MKVNKKFIRGITSICAAVTVLVSCLLTSVTAAEVNGNELLNVNDYAKFTSSADNTKVIADLTFPAEWTKTHVYWNYVGDTYGAPDLMETGNDINIHNDSIDYRFSLVMYPFSKYINVGDRVGRVITGSKVMDLRYLPSGSSFTYGFDVKITNPLTNVEDFTGTLTEHILYLDENGKVLVHERNKISDPPNFYVDGTRVIQWGGVLNIRPVEGAVGFIPFFCLKNIACDLDSDIIVNYKGLQVNFSMSNLEYESMQNGMIQDTLDNVQDSINDVGNKLDTAVNGTPEQNQQAQDAVGSLNSSTDKLGQLGDQMSSVEKPTIDSNKISAGSLVPQTSLVVLSSPFQALWENKQLLAMLTIVVTLVLVSWVFFGKKG